MYCNHRWAHATVTVQQERTRSSQVRAEEAPGRQVRSALPCPHLDLLPAGAARRILAVTVEKEQVVLKIARAGWVFKRPAGGGVAIC